MSVPLRMRAAVLHGREDVRLEEVDVAPPGEGEVLVRTEVALTCGTDVKVYRRGYHARMLVPPALFGHEAAGRVVATGEGVRGFTPGMRVAWANSAPCGSCPHCRRGRESLCDDLLFWNGAYAELARLPGRIVSRNLLAVPEGVPLRSAALLEPLACVVRGIEVSRLSPGAAVAVIGLGPIGQMLVALAVRARARVVAAGRRSGRLAAARRRGADAVLEAGEPERLGATLREASPGGRGFDVVIDATGSVPACDAALQAVGKGGLVNLFAGCPRQARVQLDAERLHYEELTIVSSFHHTPASVREAYRLIAAREIAADAFVSGEAPLAGLPGVLRGLAQGSDALKTAILPQV